MAAKPKARKRSSPTAKRERDQLIGIRLTPAMKRALDEVALEWHTTRAAVMRELIDHALNSHPRTKPRR
ncbi:MAG: hypothetical protein ACREHV_12780 [Rhizomicrobium sp.]